VKRGLPALLAGLVALLVFSPSASAVEFGTLCPADRADSSQLTLAQKGRSISGIQFDTTTPGVVTKWAVNTTGSELPPREEKLKVFRQVEPDVLKAEAESAPQLVLPWKLNEFATRIPVAVGVRFGVYSPAGALYCTPGASSEEQDTAANDVPVGGITPMNIITGVTALSVTVEPDADGDGYGDETQDRCPTNPLSQCLPLAAPPGGGTTPAPTPLALQLKAKLEGNVVAVQVTGSAAATVAVSDSFRGRAVAGPKTATLAAGQVARAYLPLSAALKQQLAKLPPKRKVNLVIDASGQTAAGGAGTASTELALHGRKKPAAHHRHSH
jgi:hypothetical protein